MSKLIEELKSGAEDELGLFEEQLHVVQAALEQSILLLSDAKTREIDFQQKYDLILLENTLLLNQLSVLQNEVIANAFTTNIAEKVDGSFEELRVKEHLSYRVGNVLVVNGKKPMKWCLIPWLLYKEVRSFRLQKRLRDKSDYDK